MTDTTKRPISAAQMVADIRGGMRKQGLMDKYGLSEKQLQSVLRKLRDLQHTKNVRTTRLIEPTTDTRRVRSDTNQEKKWHCPACNRWQPKEYEECPSCGIVVAKFVAEQAAGVRPLGPARTLEEVPAATVAGTSWGAVTAAAVVLVILGYGIIRWIDFGGKSSPTRTSSYTGFAEQPGKNPLQAGENRIPQSEVVVKYRSEQQDSVQSENTEQSIGTNDNEADASVPEGPIETEEPGGFVQEFTVNNFRETVLRVSRSMPVLVEFYSNTSLYCRRMDSIMDALAGDFKGKAAIGIVDRRERRLFMRYRIDRLPQFYVFRNGQVKEHFHGTLMKNVLAKALERHQ